MNLQCGEYALPLRGNTQRMLFPLPDPSERAQKEDKEDSHARDALPAVSVTGFFFFVLFPSAHHTGFSEKSRESILRSILRPLS